MAHKPKIALLPFSSAVFLFQITFSYEKFIVIQSIYEGGSSKLAGIRTAPMSGELFSQTHQESKMEMEQIMLISETVKLLGYDWLLKLKLPK